jgi:DNA-binding MarR family transcriptional regulator
MDPSPGDFDPVLLSRARLGIVAVLLGRKEIAFPELRALLGLTQGNLGSHLRSLEVAGYLEISKGFEERKPRTTCRLTPRGRRAFERHVATLEKLLRGRGRPSAAPPAVTSRP